MITSPHVVMRSGVGPLPPMQLEPEERGTAQPRVSYLVGRHPLTALGMGGGGLPETPWLW